MAIHPDILEMWNNRYAENGFSYGKEPNRFFKEKIDTLAPGKILLPAEGEGRNAVYAAGRGWEASAFDISSQGREKAISFAQEANVKIDYQVGECLDMDYAEKSFDTVALIFAHFPATHKVPCFYRVDEWLRPGGHIILEAFCPGHEAYQQRNPSVGGPTLSKVLQSLSEIRSVFGGYEIFTAVEEETELMEGRYHHGTGYVARFFARKK